ncbi:GntR family transcriptional regulator [Candidatus Pelagisphaera phototrophica]|uniref:GntR family transcriptional regulator n=1 Tax=Candidatus Pelagisphaera phototrophica TaxID=2684113 RepID=UPI0019F1B9F0|nr:GntR family transcriptional regulator [Candidatus Pelagisphaera phototrophica]QXD33363.1 GntR family transcriptional regulator [Candidatus Pelagisphaera phototrophica]
MNQVFMRNRIAHTYPSRSLHGSIVHELGFKIVSGAHPPGSTLPIEDELREELKVSRNAPVKLSKFYPLKDC